MLVDFSNAIGPEQLSTIFTAIELRGMLEGKQ